MTNKQLVDNIMFRCSKTDINFNKTIILQCLNQGQNDLIQNIEKQRLYWLKEGYSDTALYDSQLKTHYIQLNQTALDSMFGSDPYFSVERVSTSADDYLTKYSRISDMEWDELINGIRGQTRPRYYIKSYGGFANQYRFYLINSPNCDTSTIITIEHLAKPEVITYTDTKTNVTTPELFHDVILDYAESYAWGMVNEMKLKEFANQKASEKLQTIILNVAQTESILDTPMHVDGVYPSPYEINY